MTDFYFFGFKEEDYRRSGIHFDAPAWTELRASYGRLALDPYLPGAAKYRSRRFGRFLCRREFRESRESMIPLGHGPFFQGKQFNYQVGGIHRVFEPLEVSVRENALLRGFVRFHQRRVSEFHPDVKDWEVSVHQVRIAAAPDEPGLPTPEGVHRDGHYYVAAAA